MAATISPEVVDRLTKLMAASKFREAAELCEGLTASTPEDARPWRILLKCYVELDQFRAAFRTMDRMLRFHPWEELYCHRTYFGADGYLEMMLRRRFDFACLVCAIGIGAVTAELVGRLSWTAGAIFVLTVIIAAFAAELFSRAWSGYRYGLPGEGLITPLGKANPFVFYVTDKPIYKYDDTFGFHYVPNQQWTQLAIGDEGIVERRAFSSDRHGNLRPSDEELEPGTLNIVVIGDSFTCLPANGHKFGGADNVEWPFIMKTFLEQELGAGKTRVMNFGRVSNGVLQMMNSAAQKADELKPDLVIIAFLTRDLERPPRYVSALNVAGWMRQLMHPNRSPMPDFLHATDIGQIDARAAESLSGEQEAAFLADVRAQHEMLTRRVSGRMFRIRDLRRSFFLNYLIAGTVFTRFDLLPLDYKPAIRSIDVTSYDQHPLFQQSLDALDATKIPVIFIHLPEAEELKGKKFVPHSHTGAHLLSSFKKLITKPAYFLAQYVDLAPDDVARQFGRTAYDNHPSLWTKTIYADLITQLVLNECKANPALRRKIGLNDEA